jgi:Raf kinase inhibitor-like YbhB/YbcL family protein
MSIAHRVSKSVGSALKSLHAGDQKLAAAKIANGVLPTLQISSDWFEQGASLPVRCTADGEGLAPPLRWSKPSLETKSLVVICEDPDAPMPEPYVHWLVYAIPPTIETLDTATLSSVRQGENSKLKTGFTPAAPPPGHGIHHYHFQLFALDTSINLDRGAGRGKLFESMVGHVIDWGELIGTYKRE